MIKFIHTADIHFGMENYGKIDAATGIHTRLLDFNRALNACIDRALDEQVDLFLFAGDAYKTAHPTPTQQRLMMASLLRLFRARIPVVMVIGNHDNALSFGKAHALEIFGQIPIDGFYVISQPQTVTIHTKNGPLNILGIPWPTRASVPLQGAHAYSSGPQLAEYISQVIGNLISEEAAQLDPHTPAILAAHLTVSSGIFSGSEKRAIYGKDPLFFPSQLAVPPFDYVALGHLHRYQNLNADGYPAVVYSGSIERIDFGERKEEKGFCLVTIHEKGRTTHEFIPVPIRPFLQIEVRPNAEENQTEQIITAISKHHLKDTIVKILYHIPPGVRGRVDTAALQQACSDAHYLVGIIPLRQLPPTQPRIAHVSSEMSLTHLLETYCATKPELAQRSKKLIQKAVSLSDELDGGRSAKEL